MTKARKDGAGTFFKSSQGWVAQVRVYDDFTGKSKQIRRRARSRDHARELLKEMLENTPTTRTSPEDITVVEWLDRWMRDSLPVSGLKPKTQELYVHLVEHQLKPTLGSVKLRQFTPTQGEAWLQRLAVKPTGVQTNASKEAGETPPPITKATQRNAFNTLKRALDTAVRDGLIETNPLASLARPVSRPSPVPVTSADDVDNAILPDVANLRIGPMVTFIALTGCRLGEASGLRWADVDLEEGTATIRRSSVTAESTKTDRARTVPLLPEVVDSLRTWRQKQRQERLVMGPGWQDTQGLVFTAGTGAPIDLHNARRDMQRVLRRHGIETARPFHSLRHGLASRLLARDVPLPVVSAILGHSSIRVTADVYGHVAPVMHADQLAKAMGR